MRDTGVPDVIIAVNNGNTIFTHTGNRYNVIPTGGISIVSAANTKSTFFTKAIVNLACNGALTRSYRVNDHLTTSIVYVARGIYPHFHPLRFKLSVPIIS